MDATVGQRADTPRGALSLLERRATALIVIFLLSFAGLAWWATVRRSLDMPGMVSGLAGAASGTVHVMTAVAFIGMWVAMMAAMMLPTVAPIVLAHRMVVTKRGEGSVPTAAFIAGYLLVWSAAGLIVLPLLIGFRELASSTGGGRWVSVAAGVVLAGAGAYQFTAWKATCLRACRSPLSFLMTHDFRTGARGALRAGVSHGAYCFGCCWALMAVLLVVGLMNLVWMAAIALIFLTEKNWKHGVRLVKVAGAALIILGVGIVVRPSILESVAGIDRQAPPMMNDGMNMRSG